MSAIELSIFLRNLLEGFITFCVFMELIQINDQSSCIPNFFIPNFIILLFQISIFYCFFFTILRQKILKIHQTFKNPN